MNRAYLLVEGQTEETFVRELLAPHYARNHLYLYPIIVQTSPGYRGGITSYAKVRPQIQRLCRQDADAHVTTMFDLYALPTDFPGKSDPAWPQQRGGRDKVALIEACMSEDISKHNFIPYIMVHEFEALLFVQPERFEAWTDDSSGVVAALRAIRQDVMPEDINDDPHTAPSKRIMAVMPGYQKTVHGPLITLDVGLDALREACPHFSQWLDKLDAVANR